jgi:hypothetical protein
MTSTPEEPWPCEFCNERPALWCVTFRGPDASQNDDYICAPCLARTSVGNPPAYIAPLHEVIGGPELNTQAELEAWLARIKAKEN